MGADLTTGFGGDLFGSLLGNLGNAAIGSQFGGGGGGGGYGSAGGGGGGTNFFNPPDPMQALMTIDPQVIATLPPEVQQQLMALFQQYATQAGQFPTTPDYGGMPYTPTPTPGEQTAWERLMAASAGVPQGYGQAQGVISNLMNLYGQPQNQLTAPMTGLQEGALRQVNPFMIGAPTAGSLNLLSGAQNVGAGGLQQSLLDQLYNEAAGGNQGLSDVRGYLSRVLSPDFATPNDPQVQAVMDALKAQQQQNLEESRGRTLLDQNLYGAVPSSGTAGMLGDLERKFNLDMGTINSQALLNQLNQRQQLQLGAAGLGANVSQIPSNLMANALGQGRAQGGFMQGLIQPLQGIYDQQINRAGQLFNLGEQERGIYDTDLQRQNEDMYRRLGISAGAIPMWQQLSDIPYQQASRNFAAAGWPRSLMDTEYNRWLQQQQFTAGLPGQYGNLMQGTVTNPAGYVVNQGQQGEWYDPIVNQIGNNAVNWGLGQIGNLFGGGGGGGGGYSGGGGGDWSILNPTGGGGYTTPTIGGGQPYTPPTVGGGMNLDLQLPSGGGPPLNTNLGGDYWWNK